jgi:hypothetical protein
MAQLPRRRDHIASISTGEGMSFKDIKDQFGRSGTVASANYSHIRVRFDGRSISAPCDPRDLQLVGALVPRFSVQEITAIQ